MAARALSLPGCELRIHPDSSALADAVAGEFARAALEAVTARGKFSVALAGGGTPKLAYSRIAQAQESATRLLPWERIHIFFGDERCVPPNHPDSNFRMAREALLSRVPIPLANVHPLRGGEPPDEAAAAAEIDLRAFFELHAGEPPRLDLVLLGLGSDGHTASLFPDTAALRETTRLLCANWVPKLDAHRLTMTYPALNSAGEVLFIAAGVEKAQVLREIVQPLLGAPEHPAARVRPAGGRLVWFVDEAAASRLAPASR